MTTFGVHFLCFPGKWLYCISTAIKIMKCNLQRSKYMYYLVYKSTSHEKWHTDCFCLARPNIKSNISVIFYRNLHCCQLSINRFTAFSLHTFIDIYIFKCVQHSTSQYYPMGLQNFMNQQNISNITMLALLYGMSNQYNNHTFKHTPLIIHQ
jgi:hypothetical protein